MVYCPALVCVCMYVCMYVCTYNLGSLMFFTDDNTNDILMIWYINITTQLPTISKAFNITLPVGTDQDLKKVDVIM